MRSKTTKTCSLAAFALLAAANIAAAQDSSSPPLASPQNIEPLETTIQAFEDWRMSCAGESADSCRVWQRVQVQSGDIAQDVMAVSLAPAETPTGLALLIQTPLDVFLPTDFALRIDGGSERRVRFRNCNAGGCWVLIPANQALLSRLRRGLTGEAAFALVEGETVRISFSLRGLTAALSAYDTARLERD